MKKRVSFQFLIALFEQRLVDGRTKQVLQNMLRSRLPVSASSTIVCGGTARHQSSDYKKKGIRHDRKNEKIK